MAIRMPRALKPAEPIVASMNGSFYLNEVLKSKPEPQMDIADNEQCRLWVERKKAVELQRHKRRSRG